MFCLWSIEKINSPRSKGRTSVVPLGDLNSHNMCLMNCHYKLESQLLKMATDLFVLTRGNKIYLTTYTWSLGYVLPFSLRSTWKMQTAFHLRMLDQQRRHWLSTRSSWVTGHCPGCRRLQYSSAGREPRHDGRKNTSAFLDLQLLPNSWQDHASVQNFLGRWILTLTI